MKYFVKVTSDYWTAKNKAEEKIQKFFRECERRIYDEDQVGDFLAEIIENISKINNNYNRCKDVKLEITEPGKGWVQSEDYHIDTRCSKMTLYAETNYKGEPIKGNIPDEW